MKPQRIAWILSLSLLGIGIAYAQRPNPFLGTWTLNEAKSKIPSGAAKITKLAFEAVGQDIKQTRDGTDATGKPVHTEWTGKFNGHYYPVTVGDKGVTVAMTRVGSRTLVVTPKRGATIIARVRGVVSADGKTISVTSLGTNAAGKRVRVFAVYDKE